jgi:hypothetical protein
VAIGLFRKPSRRASPEEWRRCSSSAIDFYQSEPKLLRQLLKLKDQGDVSVYMGSNSGRWTFHPKLYLFEGKSSSTAIVGSANLTQGGVADNHEVSALLDVTDADWRQEFDDWLDELLEDGEIVEATPARVEEYERRHTIYSTQLKVAQKRAGRALEAPDGGLLTLQEILREMKADSSEKGFASAVERRARHRHEGKTVLARFAADREWTPAEFLSEYEQLITRMHSGGLHRSKTTVAKQADAFRRAVRVLLREEDRGSAVMFDLLLKGFESVTGAGTNVITETLHFIDNERFAVMNRNSVSGLAVAGFTGFPRMPTKQSVDGKMYALFCAQATEVCRKLGLDNLSQLDAVFNSAYWQKAG